MMQFSSSVIGLFIPGANKYMQLTLNSFKTASETNKLRMTFCFWATLPTIIVPLGVLFVGGLITAMLVPPLLLLAHSLVVLVFSSPAASGIPHSEAEADWIGPEIEQEPPTVTTRAPISAMMRRFVYGKEKED